MVCFTSSKAVDSGDCGRVIFPTGEPFTSTSEVGANRSWKEDQVSREKLLAELVGEVRQEDGRNEHTRMIILDSLHCKY